jgi:hypothetical protein
MIMSTTITVKLNKSANEFQAGESIGFGISAGVQVYNHKTKAKEWTNYKAAIFAKQSAQIEFYRSSLIDGAIVEISAPYERIDSFDGKNGLSLTIELIEAKLGFVFSGGQGAPAQSKQVAGHQASNNAQAPAYSGQDKNAFDDDIGF